MLYDQILALRSPEPDASMPDAIERSIEMTAWERGIHSGTRVSTGSPGGMGEWRLNGGRTRVFVSLDHELDLTRDRVKELDRPVFGARDDPSAVVGDWTARKDGRVSLERAQEGDERAGRDGY